VRDGFDRDDAVTIAEDLEHAPPAVQAEGLRAYAVQWRKAREESVRAAADEPPF
jgi:hypothetical protein